MVKIRTVGLQRAQKFVEHAPVLEEIVPGLRFLDLGTACRRAVIVMTDFLLHRRAEFILLRGGEAVKLSLDVRVHLRNGHLYFTERIALKEFRRKPVILYTDITGLHIHRRAREYRRTRQIKIADEHQPGGGPRNGVIGRYADSFRFPVEIGGQSPFRIGNGDYSARKPFPICQRSKRKIKAQGAHVGGRIRSRPARHELHIDFAPGPEIRLHL